MEHWIKEDYLKVIKIDWYKLVILAERIIIIVDPVKKNPQILKLFSGY